MLALSIARRVCPRHAAPALPMRALTVLTRDVRAESLRRFLTPLAAPSSTKSACTTQTHSTWSRSYSQLATRGSSGARSSTHLFPPRLPSSTATAAAAAAAIPRSLLASHLPVRTLMVGGGSSGGGPSRRLLITLGVWASVFVGGLILLYSVGGIWLIVVLVGGVFVYLFRAGRKLQALMQQMTGDAAKTREVFLKMTPKERDAFLRRAAAGQTMTPMSGFGGVVGNAMHASSFLGPLKAPLMSKLHASTLHHASCHPLVRRAMGQAPVGATGAGGEQLLRSNAIGFSLTATASSQPQEGDASPAGPTIACEEVFELLHPVTDAPLLISARYTVRLEPADLASLADEVDGAPQAASRSFMRGDFHRLVTFEKLEAIDQATGDRLDLNEWDRQHQANSSQPDDEPPIQEAEYTEIRSNAKK